MVRAPCCEKMGLKKGPWTKEEDQLLMNYINQHGHANWRALPKKAGLLRCGKSCRLRWANYLRPDIKRGNFTIQEEQTVFHLHQILGNRWSAIAARLPGRTDNEIKNVWHTNLKKRLTTKPTPVSHDEPQINAQTETTETTASRFDHHNHVINQDSKPVVATQLPHCPLNSPPQSSVASATINIENHPKMHETSDQLGNYSELDEDFWLDVVSSEYSPENRSLAEDRFFHVPLSPVHAADHIIHGYSFELNQHDHVNFWCDLLLGLSSN